MPKIKHPDSSHDLVLVHYQNGFMLSKPPKVPSNDSYSCSLSHFLQSAFNIYLLDTESRIRDSNEAHAATFGFPSVKSSIGLSGEDIATQETFAKLRQHDLNILKSCRSQILDEELLLTDTGESRTSLSIKSPWYDYEGQLVGILGCSIILNEEDKTESFSKLVKMGILNISTQHPHRSLQFAKSPHLANIHFSKREREVLIHLARGKSARIIGESLGISRRTIEHYIENIKVKLNVTRKSEILELIMGDDY